MRRRQRRLREELGLSRSSLGDRAVDLALQAGFDRAAIVDPRRLAPWARRAPSGSEGPPGMEWHWITRPTEWSRSSTILICCLSCFRAEPDDQSTPGDPHALVAPFARAHYYRAAIDLLRVVAGRLELEKGISRAEIRLFSNSRIPEKPLLIASGLASYGRNGCALSPGLGSLFVIAGAVIPVPTRQDSPAPPAPPDPCGSCRRCRAACPAGAIDEPFVVRRDLCLQGKAGSPHEFSAATMDIWGPRLYGCQDCQSACPQNSGLQASSAPTTGEIGPSVSLRAFLAEDALQRKARFRGTALGMSWLPGEALLRNALVAAGNKGDPAVRAQVERHLTGDSEIIRSASRWARDRL